MTGAGRAARAVFLLGAALSHPSSIWADSGWDCYRWPTTTIKYTLSATSPYSQYYVEEAVTDHDSWHNLTAVKFAQGTGGAIFRSGRYGHTGWLGMATLQVQGCTILSAETKLNRTYLDDAAQIDVAKRTACHEIGHVTGLGHNVSPQSCLRFGGSAPHSPGILDRNTLSVRYDHIRVLGFLGLPWTRPPVRTLTHATWKDVFDTPEQLAEAVDAVVVVRSTGMRLGRIARGDVDGAPAQFLVHSFSVLAVTKGDFRVGDHLLVEALSPGPATPGLRQVAAAPGYRPGSEYLIFVNRQPDSLFYYVVGDQGAFEVADGRLRSVDWDGADPLATALEGRPLDRVLSDLR